MRMRCLLPVALVLSGLTVAPLAAQVPKPAPPAFEARARSIDDLLERAEYLAGLVGKEESGRQFRDFIRSLTAEKVGLEGIDVRKPFGVYATLSANVAESPLVVMVPIADEARFFTLLKDRLGVTPKETGSGTYETQLPLFKEPVSLRFADGYLYAAVRAKGGAPAALPKPGRFFSTTDDALASATLHLDRIPDDVKAVVLGQLELRLNDARKKQEPGETAGQRQLKGLLLDGILALAKAGAAEGKALSVRLLVDAKADELTAEWSLSPKPGTALAAALAKGPGRKSVPLGIAAPVNPVARASVQLGLPDGYRKRFAAAFDGIAAESVRQAEEEDREAVRRIFDALAPTFKGDAFDAAFAFWGADAQGHHGLTFAAAVEDGKGIVALLKDFAPFVPEEAAKISFDAETVGEFALHKVEVKVPTGELQSLFGTQNVWIATSTAALAVGFEEDGTALKKALRSAPGKANYVAVEISLARLIAMSEKAVKPEELSGLIRNAFGSESPAGRDTVRLTAEGGEKLVVKASIRGKAVWLAVSVDEAKKK